MALPGNLVTDTNNRFDDNIGFEIHSGADDLTQLYYPAESGSLGVIQLPSLNGYNIFWTQINTGNNDYVSINDVYKKKGYFVRSNDKRDLFEIDQEIKIGDTTFKVDAITTPKIKLDETTEIVSSGNLSETIKTEHESRQIVINVTINRV